MSCAACNHTCANYYKMGGIAVCEDCIKNTYPYKQLESKIPDKSNLSIKTEEYKLPYFKINPSCNEYDSICSHRTRFLEQIYFDIDRLKWEIDSDKQTHRKRGKNIDG